jgi:hypothetical protein
VHELQLPKEINRSTKQAHGARYRKDVKIRRSASQALVLNHIPHFLSKTEPLCLQVKWSEIERTVFCRILLQGKIELKAGVIGEHDEQ